MKKIIPLFLIAAIVGISLFFFTSPESQNTDKPHPIFQPLPDQKRIMFYHYWDASFENLKNAVGQQADAFNSFHNEVRLVPTPLSHEAYKSNIIAMLEGADLPELFSYWAGARTENLAGNDLLQPLDDLWKTNNLDSIFPQSVSQNACTYNRRKYMIPLIQCYIGFFYNVSVFKENNITPPHTWDEFLNVCETLKANGTTPIALGNRELWPGQFWFDYTILRTAGLEFRKKLMNGEIPVNSPQVLNALQYWKHLLEKGYFNNAPSSGDWREAALLVHNRGAGMTLMGTWAMDAFHQWGAKGGEDFAFFSFPVIDPGVKNTMLNVVDGVVMSKPKKNVEAGEEVLLYLTTVPVQQKISTASGNFSPRNDIPSDHYSNIQKEILRQVPDELAFAYDLSTLPGVEKLGLKAFARIIENPQNLNTILKNLENDSRPIFQKQKSR